MSANQTNINVREIKQYDEVVYQAVVKLLPQLTSRQCSFTKEYFIEILASGSTHFFVAENEAADIVGIFSIITYKIPSGTEYSIEDVVVDKNSRRKGYGKALILYAINFLKVKGVLRVGLTSRPSRKEANELYQQIGFEKRETNVYRYKIQ